MGKKYNEINDIPNEVEEVVEVNENTEEKGERSAMDDIHVLERKIQAVTEMSARETTRINGEFDSLKKELAELASKKAPTEAKADEETVKKLDYLKKNLDALAKKVEVIDKRAAGKTVNPEKVAECIATNRSLVALCAELKGKIDDLDAKVKDVDMAWYNQRFREYLQEYTDKVIPQIDELKTQIDELKNQPIICPPPVKEDEAIYSAVAELQRQIDELKNRPVVEPQEGLENRVRSLEITFGKMTDQPIPKDEELYSKLQAAEKTIATQAEEIAELKKQVALLAVKTAEPIISVERTAPENLKEVFRKAYSKKDELSEYERANPEPEKPHHRAFFFIYEDEEYLVALPEKHRVIDAARRITGKKDPEIRENVECWATAEGRYVRELSIIERINLGEVQKK